MRLKNLPDGEKEALDSAFSSSKSAKEQTRIQSIRLLTKGYSHTEVIEITRLSEGSLKKLIAAYRRDGIAGLRLQPHPKNNAALTDRQKKAIKKMLTTKEKPSDADVKVGGDEDYWSISTLRLLIKQRFGIVYKQKDSYRRLLQYCGYTYQRVEFEDERKRNEAAEDFKKRATIKLKKGTMSMWW